MISSRRSTAPSYVIASAAISCLLLRVDYLGADAAVGQPDVEAPGLARRRGCGQRLAVVVQEQCVAALEGALRVVGAQRGRAGRQRLGAPFLECAAGALERGGTVRQLVLAPRRLCGGAIDRPAAGGDRHAPGRDGAKRGLAPPPDHARGDAALKVVPDA